MSDAVLEAASRREVVDLFKLHDGKITEKLSYVKG
jgi:hypothetical protein